VPATSFSAAETQGATLVKSAAHEDGTPAPRRLLIVERGRAAAKAIAGIAPDGGEVVTTTVSSADAAAAMLAGDRFDCIVLGPGIPKTAVFGLLERIRGEPGFHGAPLIVYLKRALLAREKARLRGFEPAIVAKVVESPEQLTAATAAALRRKPTGRSGESPAELAQPDLAALRGRKLLLVDDDVRNLFALASLLEDRGIEVVFGETGKEALSALDRHRDIDLVLMDIMMPGMDGNETIAAIRQDLGLRALPIIAVTAKAMEGDRERSLTVGASDYITKPVEPDRLLSLIGTWLQR
jgi:CheY-like chemotaxis protein